MHLLQILLRNSHSDLPAYLCGCCKSTSNTALPGSSPVPKIPVRPRKAVRKRWSDNAVCPSCAHRDQLVDIDITRSARLQ